MYLKDKNIDAKRSGVILPVTYPVADIFQESRGVHCGLCLPQGLLNAAAIEEHILPLRVAVEITEDLQRPNKQERKFRSGLWVS